MLCTEPSHLTSYSTCRVAAERKWRWEFKDWLLPRLDSGHMSLRTSRLVRVCKTSQQPICQIPLPWLWTLPSQIAYFDPDQLPSILQKLPDSICGVQKPPISIVGCRSPSSCRFSTYLPRKSQWPQHISYSVYCLKHSPLHCSQLSICSWVESITEIRERMSCESIEKSKGQKREFVRT